MPLSLIGTSPLATECFTECLRSSPQCTCLQPIASSSSVTKYIGLIGHGTNTCVCSIGLGVCCVLDGIFSMKEGNSLHRIFTLPNLAEPSHDKYMVMTVKNASMITTMNDKNGFDVIPSLFEKKEPTINMGVMNGHYVQITPTKVLSVTDTENRGTWTLSGDSRILYSSLGNRYILLITNKREVICLRLTEEGATTQFTSLEKGISKEMTCIMEYKDFILVGMKERSICCFAVEGTALVEKGTFPVNSVPYSLYSFCNVAGAQYSQFKSSSDDVLLIGGDTGVLTIASFKPEEERMEVISEVRIDSTTVQFSHCILRGVPVLLVSAGASYRIIFRNDIFNVLPIFFRSKLDRAHPSFSPTAHLHNIAVYHKGKSSITLMWQNENIISVRLETKAPGISIYSRPIQITGRQIIPLPRGNALVIGYDFLRHHGAMGCFGYACAFWNDNNGCFQMKDLSKTLARRSNEAISCACCLSRGQTEEEVNDWLLVGSFNGLASEYYFSLYRGDLSNMFGGFSARRSLRRHRVDGQDADRVLAPADGGEGVLRAGAGRHEGGGGVRVLLASVRRERGRGVARVPDSRGGLGAI